MVVHATHARGQAHQVRVPHMHAQVGSVVELRLEHAETVVTPREHLQVDRAGDEVLRSLVEHSHATAYAAVGLTRNLGRPRLHCTVPAATSCQTISVPKQVSASRSSIVTQSRWKLMGP